MEADRARVVRDEQWIERMKGPPRLRPIGGRTGLRSLPKSGQFPPLLPCSTRVFLGGRHDVEWLGYEHGQRTCCFPAVRLWLLLVFALACPSSGTRYVGSIGLGVESKGGREMRGRGEVSIARPAFEP